MSKHASLDTVVADGIRKTILSGELRLGAHLVEADFAKQFDVSHGTIRSALKRLEHEGLVEFVPRRGMFVIELRPEDAIELCTLRDSLEALAARQAASKATPQELRKLKSILDRMDAASKRGDRKACVALDMEFHRQIVDCARHTRLSGMYAQLASQTELFMNLTDPLHEGLEHMVPLHEPIVDALERRDAELAYRLSADHNQRDGQMLAARIAAISEI